MADLKCPAVTTSYDYLLPRVLVLVALRLVIHLHRMGIHGDVQFTKHTPREEAHPLFLVGIESLI